MTVAEKSRVLFVDGEQRVLNSMRAMFGCDYDLFLTTNGAEALRIIYDGNIDVVVADHGVAGVSGLDVLDWARVRSPDSVRVLIADYTVHDQLKRACIENDVFLCLPKPCLPNKLRDAIRQAVEFASESRDKGTSNTVAKQNKAANAIPVDRPVASRAPGTVPGPSSLPSETVPNSDPVADAEQKEPPIDYRRVSDDAPEDETGLFKVSAILKSPVQSESQPKTAATAPTLQSGTPADSTPDRSEPEPKTAATAPTLQSGTPADSMPDRSEPESKTAATAPTLQSGTPADSTPDRSEPESKTAATAPTLQSGTPADSMPDRSEPESKTVATAPTLQSKTPADSTPDRSESEPKTAATAPTLQSKTPADSTPDRSESEPKTTATAPTLQSGTPADSTPDRSESEPKTAATAPTLQSGTPADSTPDESEPEPKTVATAPTLQSGTPADSTPDRSEPEPKTAATAPTLQPKPPADSTPDRSESEPKTAATAPARQSPAPDPGAHADTSGNAPEQPGESARSPLVARATSFKTTETQHDASVVVYAVEPTFIATARLALEPRYGVYVTHSIIDSIECLCREGSSVLLMDVSGNATVVRRMVMAFKVLVPDLTIIATVDNIDDEGLSDLEDSVDGVQLFSKPLSAQICLDGIMAAERTRAGFAAASDKAPHVDPDWQATAGRAARKAGGLEERLSRLAKRMRTS